MIESVSLADQMSSWNPDHEREVANRLSSFDIRRLPHAGFAAELERTALGYVSTGECTAYASTGPVPGVSCYAQAVASFQEAQQRAGEGSK